MYHKINRTWPVCLIININEVVLNENETILQTSKQ